MLQFNFNESKDQITMDILQIFAEELTQEYNTTKKFFEIYPEGKNDYAPHEKSMKMGHLATHIAEIFSWAGFMLTTDALDLAEQPTPVILSTPKELLDKMKENYDQSMAELQKASEENLKGSWALKHNGHVLAEWSKYAAIRHSLDQITHHRAQLGVYYRLNDISVPGSYGPSADQQNF